MKGGRIISKSDSGHFKGTAGQGKTLIDEVAARGDKINPSEIIGFTKDNQNKIVWLEKGAFRFFSKRFGTHNEYPRD